MQAKDVAGLTPATIGKSGDLDVGEQVVAVGSPYGLDATVTSGIVSALNRPVAVGQDAQGNSTTYPAIQTDAAINPGNSGGPLVDMEGRVIGINASIRPADNGGNGSIGLGFAIPIDEVLPIVEQMKDGETPTHARLGITVRDAADTTGAEITDGAEIQEITNGSAADDAGLEQGDVITKIDDHLVNSSDALVATVRSYRPGDEVEVTYQRDGETDTDHADVGVRRRLEQLLASPLDPALVPHRTVGLVDLAVGAVDEEPVEPAREPAVVGHREHGSLERLEPLLERLGGLHVQVVGRLVEQQQGRSGQLEQQDLEPGLLPSAEALELLLGGVGELVAVQHAGGLLAAHAVARARRHDAGSRGGCGR